MPTVVHQRRPSSSIVLGVGVGDGVRGLPDLAQRGDAGRRRGPRSVVAATGSTSTGSRMPASARARTRVAAHAASSTRCVAPRLLGSAADRVGRGAGSGGGLVAAAGRRRRGGGHVRGPAVGGGRLSTRRRTGGACGAADRGRRRVLAVGRGCGSPRGRGRRRVGGGVRSARMSSVVAARSQCRSSGRRRVCAASIRDSSSSMAARTAAGAASGVGVPARCGGRGRIRARTAPTRSGSGSGPPAVCRVRRWRGRRQVGAVDLDPGQGGQQARGGALPGAGGDRHGEVVALGHHRGLAGQRGRQRSPPGPGRRRINQLRAGRGVQPTRHRMRAWRAGVGAVAWGGAPGARSVVAGSCRYGGSSRACRVVRAGCAGRVADRAQEVARRGAGGGRGVAGRVRGVGLGGGEAGAEGEGLVRGRRRRRATAAATVSRSSSGAMPTRFAGGRLGAEDLGDALANAISSRSWGAQPISPRPCRAARLRGGAHRAAVDPSWRGQVVVGGHLDLGGEPARRAHRTGPRRARRGCARPPRRTRRRRDDLAAVGLDGDLAAPVHRRIHHREHGGRDQGGVVDEQGPALAHRPHQRAVHEHVPAVGGLGVLADQVGDRGVAVAGAR